MLLTVLAEQADGLALNATTLTVVTAMVAALGGAIVFLFKMATSNQAKQIDRLTEERDLLLDRLFDMTRTADRAVDAGAEAAELLARRKPRTKR